MALVGILEAYYWQLPESIWHMFYGAGCWWRGLVITKVHR